MIFKSSLFALALMFTTQSSSIASEGTERPQFNKVDHPGPDIFAFLRGTWTSKLDATGATREVWDGEGNEGFERVREYRVKNALVGAEVTQFRGYPYGTGGTADTVGDVPTPKRSSESVIVEDYGADNILLKYYSEGTKELYQVHGGSMTLTRTLPSKAVETLDFRKDVLRPWRCGRDVRMPKTTPSNH